MGPTWLPERSNAPPKAMHLDPTLDKYPHLNRREKRLGGGTNGSLGPKFAMRTPILAPEEPETPGLITIQRYG
jgi:hypothetical protein